MNEVEKKIREAYSGILSEEQIEKTLEWWKSLIQEERQGAVENFIAGLKDQFANHIITETYDEEKGEDIDGEVAMNVDKALSQCGPEIIDLFYKDWKEEHE